MNPVLTNINQRPLVWLIIIFSCIPYTILSSNNLSAISNWFMPDTLIELIQPFSLWRLWTPTFVHYTPLHLITNLYLWWLFASKIEQQSRLELFLVTVISAACANLCQWWILGSKFGGLSGVVYALMGYLWILNQFGGKENYRIDPIIAILLLGIIPLSATGVFGKLANYAHLGGLASGIVLAFAYLLINRQTGKTNTINK